MSAIITVLCIITQFGINLNQGILPEERNETFTRLHRNPLFSSVVPLQALGFSAMREAPRFDDSLNFRLISDYNLAGNYLNMSGWQVKPFGDYLLFSSGGGFYVFTKDSLRKVQEISGPGYIWDFEIRGNYVFGANGDKGLVVYDLSSLQGNRVIAQLDIPYEEPSYNPIFGWGATGIDLIDSFAIVTVRIGGLFVINIADPHHPQIVASHLAHDWLMDVHIRDTFAYVTQYGPDDNNAFIVYSINDPTHPYVLSALTNLPKGMRFALRDTIAYVPGRYNGVAAVNISDPRNPHVLGTLSLSEAQNVTLLPRGDTLYAFIANLNNLVVADFSHPASPHELTTVEVRSTADYIEGNRLYHQGLAGAVLYDITYPYNPQLDTFYIYLGNPYYLQVQGNYAYIYDGYGCLRILDISDHSDITEIAYTYEFLDSIPSGSWIADIGGMVIQDDHAYLIVRGFPWFCYLAIVKVSDPANPDWVGTKMWRDYAGGNQPFVEDTLAYVPTASSGQTFLRIIDIGDPGNIEDIGMLHWPTWAALEVTKQDSLLYMAGGYDPSGGTQQTFRDLGIVSVARPWIPRLITEFTSPNQCHGADRFATTPHLALADYVAGVHILDVSNPASPFITGTVDFEGYVEDVHIGRNLVFTCAGTQFAGIDAANRTNPQLYGYYYLFPKFSAIYISCTDVWSIEDSLGAVTTTGGLFLFRTDYIGIGEEYQPRSKIPLPLATITRGRLKLTLPEEQAKTAQSQLLDASGRILMRLQAGENNISHLPPGVYFIKMNTERSTYQERLVLVR